MTSLREPSSWLIAAGGLILYLWAPTTLYGLGVQRSPAMPAWVPFVAPLVVYGLLFVALRRLSVPQRIAGVIGLYSVHFLLGLATETIYSDGGPLPLGVPLEQALWASRAAPLLQLLSVPLAVWPFRDFIAGDRRFRTSGPALVFEDFTPPPLRLTPPPTRVTPLPVRLAPVAEPSVPPSTAPLIFVQPAQAEANKHHATAAAVAPPPPPVPVVAVREPFPPPVVAIEPLPLTAAVREEAIRPPVEESVRAIDSVPVVEPPVETAIEEHPAVEAASPAVIEEEPIVEATPSLTAEAEPVPIVGELTPQPVLAPADVAEAERLCAPLMRVGSLKVEAQLLMGVKLFTAYSARLARDAVVRDAFRVLARLADSPGLRALDQVTLRASAGAMVLTPLGPLGGGGPVLIVAVPLRGSLALLEILSRRAAAEYHAAYQAPSGQPGGLSSGRPTPDLSEIATPAGMLQVARIVGTGGGIAPLALRDRAGQLSLYLFLAPGVDGHGIGRVACGLRDLMEIDGETGGIGAIQSVALRLGDQWLMIRQGVGAERSTLLVSAGPTSVQPGLVHLQLDRAAQRLAAV